MAVLEDYPLNTGDQLPTFWVNQIQQALSSLAPSIRLTQPTLQSLRIDGTVDRRGAVVQGLWRFVDTTRDATHPGGAAGSYDVLIVASANNIVNAPSPFTDNTDYNFYPQIVATGASPSGNTPAGNPIVAWRKIGECDWDGTNITGFRQTHGATDTTLPAEPHAPSAKAWALRVVAAPSQDPAVPIAKVTDSTGATLLWAVYSTGVSIGTLTVNSLTVNNNLSVGGNETVTGTLGVTGASTVAAVTASGQISAQGAGTGLSVTNNATVGGTLGVTGTSTLAAINASGAYTQTGTGANTFTGATAFSAAGTALSVTNNAIVSGTLTVGTALFKNAADSTTAFRVQNAAGTNELVVDTTNQRVAVGSAAVPANGALTVGTNTTAATGGVYFGTDTNLYRSAVSTLKTDGALAVGGNVGFYGTAPVAQSTGWGTITAGPYGGASYKTPLTASATLGNVIDYVSTLAAYLKALGLIAT